MNLKLMNQSVKKKPGPPMLGDLVGNETKGGELGNIVRHYTKTAGGIKVKKRPRNLKKKTLEVQSLNFTAQEKHRDMDELKRYEFTGGKIQIPIPKDAAMQSDSHLRNFNNSIFGGSVNGKSEATRYQTNNEVSFQVYNGEDNP
jgi:hypothetical protein